jgi:glycosyltransferase involved in cell wall biosynthesis
MKSLHTHKFTVFTPTFNRKELLKPLYQSLKQQTFKDFEWLIVDDGSTDDTESLIFDWIKENLIPIRYFKQKNQGKHMAINLGVQQAKGEFFLIIDSDDYCVNDALERFVFYWNNIPEEKRNEFAGIMSNCKDVNGNIIGSELTCPIIDASIIDAYHKFKIRGDKCGFYLTEILKKYPFPIIDNEKFLTEALIWNRIGLKYKILFVNEKLFTKNYQSNGLSDLSLKLRVKNPLGAILYYQEFLSLPVSFKWKMRNFINYLRFSFHAKKNIFKQISLLNNLWLKLISPVFVIISYFIYKLDVQKIKI